MRFGGPLPEKHANSDDWIETLKRLGYSAAYWPLGDEAGEDEIDAYVEAAAEADVVIAEVGAWSNPLSPEEPTRREALALCQRRLGLAERIGARCCVNIAGSRGRQWDGPDPANLTDETFDLIVASVREIVDAVRPTRTFYTLETMPWMYPDSAESYARLIEAIDRPAFGVHFDPVNLVCSPQAFHANAEMIRDFIARLGPNVRSCHAKDVALSGKLTVHLDEVRPGLGGLDFAALLKGLDSLDPDTPLMMEHLGGADEYALAAEHIRSVAGKVAVAFR